MLLCLLIGLADCPKVDETMWSMVPDNGQTRIEPQLRGRTDLNRVDYSSKIS
jgi:hypothetical protein